MFLLHGLLNKNTASYTCSRLVPAIGPFPILIVSGSYHKRQGRGKNCSEQQTMGMGTIGLAHGKCLPVIGLF